MSERLLDRATPVLTLCEPAVRANIESFAQWCRDRGVEHAPHGKTTMAPQLWEWQLSAGSWAITVANARQLAVAVRAGVPRIMVANEIVDATAAGLVADAILRDQAVQLWVDSIDGVELLDKALGQAGVRERVGALVEVGWPGARCGTRTLEQAHAVAKAVVASQHLALVGVAGFEGVLAAHRSSANRELVRTYLHSIVAAYARCAELFAPGLVVLTAGGSSWYDEVVEVLAPVAAADPRVRVVLRCGGYVTHDHGHYATNSPTATGHGPSLAPALRLWSRIISAPEPGLAFLDAGKRDLPYDEGLPRILHSWGRMAAVPRPIEGAVISSTHDQHARVEHVDPELRVGDLIELGISHPCTAFDKWREIPVLEANDPTARIVGYVTTHF